MKNSRITIIGAGWLGLPLAVALKEAGHTVTGTVTKKEGLQALLDQGIQAQVLRLQEKGTQIPASDIVIVTVPPSGGDTLYRRQLVQASRLALAAGATKLIFCSSTSVYPDQGQEVTEADAQNFPSIHSGVRMLLMEQVFTHNPDLQATVLRWGGLIGPDRHPARFMANKKEVSGPDTPINMIHRTDCIDIIKTIIDQDAWGQTFNAVAPEHPTRKEFYKAACKDAKRRAPTWKPGTSPFKIVLSNHLTSTLNYNFTYPDPIKAIPACN